MESQTGDARRPLTQFSSRYISYLKPGAERRQLKGVAAPADNFVPVGMLNGHKVERKGRGQPPASNKEAEQGRHGRRVVPGRSYFAADRLLQPSAAEEPGAAQHFSRKVAACHNTSSMSGAGALLPRSAKLAQGAAPEHKVCRRPGTANPGRGLGSAMAATLAFEPEAQLRGQASQLWRAAGLPSLCDSIIRHRYSDPDTPATPAKLEVERPPSPGLQGLGLSESRSAYFGAQNEYVSNKAHAIYGFSHHRSRC